MRFSIDPEFEHVSRNMINKKHLETLIDEAGGSVYFVNLAQNLKVVRLLRLLELVISTLQKNAQRRERLCQHTLKL